jgi:hypothetical protein
MLFRSSARVVAAHVGVILNSSEISQDILNMNQVVVTSNPKMAMLIYTVGDLSPTLLNIGMICYNASVNPQEFARATTHLIYYGQKLVGRKRSTISSVVMIRGLSWMQ